MCVCVCVCVCLMAGDKTEQMANQAADFNRMAEELARMQMNKRWWEF